MHYCTYCFGIGFIIDKINLFPFILGCIIGIFITKNAEIYDSIKVPVSQIYKFTLDKINKVK